MEDGPDNKIIELEIMIRLIYIETVYTRTRQGRTLPALV